MQDPEARKLAAAMYETVLAEEEIKKRTNIKERAQPLKERKFLLEASLDDQEQHKDVQKMFQHKKESALLHKQNTEWINSHINAISYNKKKKRLRTINAKLTSINKEGKHNGLKQAIVSFHSTQNKKKRKKEDDVNILIKIHEEEEKLE